MPDSPYLTEQEVEKRLESMTDSEIIGDMYSFGQKLLEQALERVRSVEHKATFFAAYGSAIITLLASTSPKWSDPLGNQHTMWIALCAGLCAVFCTLFSIRALRLRQVEFITDAAWLHADCLSDALMLKKYRTLTLWGAIDSRIKTQERKARELQYAEVSLMFSGLFLLCLLVQLAYVQTFWRGIHNKSMDAFRHFLVIRPLMGDIGDNLTFLILIGLLLWFAYVLRGIRRS